METRVPVKGKNYSFNNVGKKRRAADFYETPYHMTDLLLAERILPEPILEPACGNGAIVRRLQAGGYEEISWHDKEKDFLTANEVAETIITNPPFSLAMEFILKAKSAARSHIYFLLPLSYLQSKSRYDKVWTDREFPLAEIFVFTRFALLGEPLRDDGRTNTGMQAYAWYHWHRGHEHEPDIHWLDNDKHILRKKDKED